MAAGWLAGWLTDWLCLPELTACMVTQLINGRTDCGLTDLLTYLPTYLRDPCATPGRRLPLTDEPHAAGVPSSRNSHSISNHSKYSHMPQAYLVVSGK